MKVHYAVLLALVLGVGCGGGKKDEWPEFKTCERCKETDIKYWADVCKHCGKDPDGPDGAEKRAELRKIWLEAKRSSEAAPNIEYQGDVFERAIRERLEKPTGELTKADLEKVTRLSFAGGGLTKLPKGTGEAYAVNISGSHTQSTD